MENNKMYKWDTKGWISSSWQWVDMKTSKVVINANEQLTAFRNSGEISTNLQNGDDELLIGLGIHLKNKVPIANNISIFLGIIVLLIFLPRIF